MGALEFEPAQLKPNTNSFLVEINSLVEIAGRMLDRRRKFEANLNEDEERAMMEILKTARLFSATAITIYIAFASIARHSQRIPCICPPS